MKRQTFCRRDRAVRSGLLRNILLSASVPVCFLLLLFLFSPPGEAAQIKRVQSQSATFGDYETVKQQTLTYPVELEKSFVISTAQCDDLHASSVSASVRIDGGEGLGLYMSNFEDSSTVNLERVRGTDKGDNFPGIVQATEIEFGSNVKVHRGFSTFGDTTVTKNIALPTLQSNSYFPIVSVKAMEWFVDETEAFQIKASFPNDYTLRLERKDGTLGYQNTGPTSVTVAWQVIELLNDAVVRKGEKQITAASATATVNLTTESTGQISDINKAFLVFTYTGGVYGAGSLDGVDAQTMVRGTITDTNTLTFTRGVGGTTGDDIYISWYLIELQDDSSLVQKGTMPFLATDFTKTKSDLTAVDTSRAFPIISVAGGTSTTSAVNLHNYLVRAVLTANNTLTLTRTDDTDLGTGVTEIPVDVDWFVVEFAPLTLTAPNTQVALEIGKPATISWQYADSLKSNGSGSGGVHQVKLELTKNGTDYYTIPNAGTLDVDTGTLDNTHSFSWAEVPAGITGIDNLIGETLKVKISDIESGAGPRNYDRSNMNFIVKGSIAMDQPPSQEENLWKVGQTVNLGWTTRGNMNLLATKTVTLEVSPDGTNFYEITTTPTDPQAGNDNDHSTATTWTIPEDIGGKSLIGSDNILRIRSDYNPAPADVTKVEDVTEVFTIKGVISNVRVTELDGTTELNTTDHPLLRGGDYKIKWDKLGHWGANNTEGTVDIQYSENGGATYITILSAIPSGAHDTGGTYDWNAVSQSGTPIGSTSRIKVVQTGDYTVGDESADFMIKLGNVYLSSPNSGTFDLGAPLNITWTASTNLSNVSIYFSPNNGGKWIQLGEVAANSSPFPFPWNSESLIESPVTTEGLIKVASSEFPTTVFSVSTSNITIQGAIEVTSPGAGNVWEIGETNKTIDWNQTGTFDKVKIYVSRNLGGTWVAIDEDVNPATEKPYILPLVEAPGSATNESLIKVVHGKWSSIYDNSGAFTIRATITADNPASPPWRVDTTPTVTWSLNGSVSMVDILYKKGVAGTPVCLTPTGTGVDADNIDPTHGSWSWTPYNLYSKVPDDLSDETYIIVRDHDRNEILSVNSTPFKIKGSIVFNQEIGGGTGYIKAGEKQTINFTVKGSVGAKTVNLRLSTDGVNYGNPVATLAINGANTYSIEWTPQGSDYGSGRRLKLAIDGDEDLITGTANQSNTFSIEPSLDLTYPSDQGTGPFNMGGEMIIRWTPNPSNISFGKVHIKYSKDGGAYTGTVTSSSIDSNNLEGGSVGYKWVLNDGDACGSVIKLKIYLDVDGKRDIVCDESAYSFAILGGVVLQDDAKTGGVIWEMGEPHSISWTPTGSIGNINILYSKAATPAYSYYVVKNISSGMSGVKSTYDWTIQYKEGALSDTDVGYVNFEKNEDIRFKIETVDHAITDVSANPLTIKSKIMLNSPSGQNPALKVYAGAGDEVDIDWFSYDVCEECIPSKAASPKVNIKYNTNGGIGDYTGEIYLGYDNILGYSWHIPPTVPIGKNLKVKVYSDNFSDIGDASAQAFRVIGQMKVNSPVGVQGLDNAWEVHRAGVLENTKPITWTNYGNLLGSVQVLYSWVGDFVNAANYTELTASASGANGQQTLNFNVPDRIGTTNQIKIIDLDADPDTRATAITSETFDIIGKIKLLEPYNGEVYDMGEDVTVRWQYAGTIGGLNFFYSANGDAGPWIPVNATPVAYNYGETSNICYYTWNKDDLPGAGTYRFKVEAATAGKCKSVVGLSDFTIRGNVILLSPGKDAGNPEVWFVNDNVNNVITWNPLGGIQKVDITLDRDSRSVLDPEIPIATGIDANSPSYTWGIPDEATKIAATSNYCRIRIYVNGDHTISDASTNDFKIKPVVTLDNLTGLPWKVQTLHDITWTKTGKIGDGELRIYFNNGTQDILLATVDGGDGGGEKSYPWTINPDAGYTVVTDSGKIKVIRYCDNGLGVLEEDTQVKSEKSVRIVGKIAVTSPIARTTYFAAQPATITWTTKNVTQNLQILYSTSYSDDGNPDNDFPAASFSVISGCENIPYTDTSKEFTMPTDVTQHVKFRVVQNDKPTEVYGDSADCIIKGGLTVTTETAENRNLTVGTQHSFSWVPTGTFTKLKAYYIIDGVKKPINEDLNGGLTSVTWTPGDTDISSNILFRIEDYYDGANIYSQTPEDFKYNCVGTFSITSPRTDLNNELTVGQQGDYIKWIKQGAIGTLKIDLVQGGVLVSPADANLSLAQEYPAGNSGEENKYSWTVPDKIGKNNCRIRITPSLQAGLMKESDLFSIKGGFIANSVSSPLADGTDIWYVGEGSHDIVWQANGHMSKVRIELSLANGTPRTYLPTAIVEEAVPVEVGTNTYKYAWAFADSLADQRSNDCKVQIIDGDYTTQKLESSVFTIKPKITVKAPTEEWIAQTQPKIDWENILGSQTTLIDILLDTDGDGFGDGGDQVLTPAAGIAKDTVRPYTSPYTLSSTVTDTATIRIQDHNTAVKSFVYGESETPFPIKGSILVDTPATMTMGDTEKVISWTYKGSFTEVNIWADYNGDGTYDQKLTPTPVSVGAGGNGSWTWATIPDQVSNDVILKVEAVGTTQVPPGLTQKFAILGKIDVTSPNGATVHIEDDISESITIKWKSWGTNISKVKLSYSTTGLDPYIPIDASVDNIQDADGSEENTWVWNKLRAVPIPRDVSSKDMKIRVEASTPAQAAAKDESAAFMLCGSIYLDPIADPVWEADGTTPNTISWEMAGQIDTVAVYYASDGSTFGATPIIASTNAHNLDATHGSCTWTVPATVGDNDNWLSNGEVAKIRVQDTRDYFNVSVVDESLPFTVKGILSFSAATLTDLSNGLTAGVQKAITFERKGKVNEVQLRYSRDNAGSFPDPYIIASNITFAAGATSKTVNWTPPEYVGAQSKGNGYALRIVDTANPDTDYKVDSPVFTVKSETKYTGPTPGTYYIGNNPTITWDILHGDIANVKVIGSRSGNFDDLGTPGSDIFVINAQTNARNVDADSGSCPWNIQELSPSILTNTLKIKIVNTDADSAYGTGEGLFSTSGAFTIKGALTIDKPTVDWNVGDQDKLIIWTPQGSIQKFNLYFSPDNGAAGTWIPINDPAAGTTGTNYGVGQKSYSTANWYNSTGVPDVKSKTCKLKVVDFANPDEITAVSADTFNVYPKISNVVIVPSTGDEALNPKVWRAELDGTQVKWTDTSTKIAKVDIWYSPNGTANLASFVTGVDSLVNGENTATFTAPSQLSVGTNALIRVRDNESGYESLVYKDSELFRVLGRIEIDNDRYIEDWKVGDTNRQVAWSAYGTGLNTVNIYIDYGSGYLPTPLVTLAANASPWTFDDDPAVGSQVGDHVTENAKIKIQDTDPARKDFTYDESPLFHIAGSLSNIVVSPALPNAPDNEDAPVAGEAGAHISWSKVGTAITHVKLEYSNNNGAIGSWITLDDGIAPAGLVPAGESYTWTPPAADILNNLGLIKVSDPDNANTTFTKPAPFSVKSKVKVTTPNFTNNNPGWEVGKQYTIKWTKWGDFDYVNIYYRAEDTDEWQPVDSGVQKASHKVDDEDHGEYPWNMPSSTKLGTGTARIKVVDAGQESLCTPVISDAFTTQGSVAVLEPDGTGQYVAGEPVTVRWQRFGDIQGVNVYFSKTGGSTWEESTPISLGNTFPVGSDTDSIPWTPPEEVDIDYMIEVRDMDNPDIKNQSVAFTVEGKLDLTYPDQQTGVTYEISQAGQNAITWDILHGNIQNVRIIGSRSGTFSGANDLFTITTDPVDADNVLAFDAGRVGVKGQGQFVWNFPEQTPTIVSSSVRIRVMDADTTNYPNVKNSSQNTCTIKGRFDILRPLTSDSLACDTPFTVRWNTYGAVSAVKLQCKNENTGDWIDIPNSAISNNPGTAGGPALTTYNWSPDGSTVGVAAQTQVRVVQTDGDKNVSKESGQFPTTGWFEFDVGDLPGLGASWEIEPTSAYLITWTNHGVETPVKLEYWDGAAYQPIVDSMANNGFLNWTPGASTKLNQYSKIRVSKVGALDNNAVSDEFSLHGKVAITDPVDATDGRNFKFGKGYPITFSVLKGNNMKLRLDYSNVAGTPSFVKPLVANIELSKDQSYTHTWNIAEASGDVQSTNVVIRVADQNDVANCNATTALDDRFKIQCVFDVTQPDGSVPWQVDDEEYIRWTSTAGTCSRVNVWYTANANDTIPTWELVYDPADYPIGYPNNPVGTPNAYLWKVTDPRSNFCKVKVTDFRDNSAENLSDPFAIKGSIRILDPSAHQDLDILGSHDIKWEIFGNIDKVSIWYSLDGTYTLDNGLPGNPIASDISIAPYLQADGTYKYPWDPIPDKAHNNVYVIVAPTDVTEGDISNDHSTIRAVLTLDAIEPVLRVGDTKIIAWAKSGTIDTVKIEFSLDNFAVPANTVVLDGSYDADAQPAGTPLNRYGYEWNITKDFMCKLPTDQARIRIQSSDQLNQPSTVSIAGPFLVKGNIEMKYPHTGEKLDVDGYCDIEWETRGDLNIITGAKFKLLLDPEGDGTYLPTPLTSDAAPGNDNTTSTFRWQPIPNLIYTDTMIIKGILTVSGVEDQTVFDLTSPFTIRANLKMLFPNGPSDYIIHQKTNQYITWEKHGTVGSVDINLDANGGLNDYDIPIASDVSPNGSFAWSNLIPDTLVGDNFKIKVSDHNTGSQTLAGESAASFKIRGSLAFVPASVPVNGDVWMIGDTKRIQWVKVGPISTVILEYSTGGGVYNRITDVNGNPVAELPAEPSYFDWKIPQAAKSTTCKLRIREKRLDGGGGEIIDVFEIRPALTDTFIIRGGFTWVANKPPAGQVYELTQSIPLEWITFGGMSTVRLEFSTNNNDWYPVKNTAIISNTGNELLALDPAKTGMDVANPFYIRIQDPDDPYAEAKIAVKVKGKITWTSPTGATTWKAGESGTITWTPLGSIGLVKVEYVKEGGGSGVIAGEVQASDNGCPWPIIPADAVGSTKIVLTQKSDATITWDSVYVPVRANFVFSEPIATTVWYVDDPANIIWTTYGTISKVNITYWAKTNEWLEVVSNLDNNASGMQTTFPWPHVPDNIRDDVRIKIADAGLSGTVAESAPFKIRGQITLLNPAEPLKIGRQYKIEWTEKGHADEVEIWFYNGSTWQQIPGDGVRLPNSPVNHSYIWPSVSDVVLPLENAQFRIKTVGYDIEDYSASFKVLPDFNIVAPSFNQVFTVNTAPNIVWTCTSANVEFVNLDYSIDGGAYQPISAAPVPNPTTIGQQGQYPWTLTSTSACSSNALVRITAIVPGSTVQGAKESQSFYIRPVFSLQTPNSDPEEKFIIGRQNNIIWQCAGDLSQVKIQYSALGDFSDIQNLPGVANGLVSNAVGSNTFPWTIPDGLFTDNAKIRITAPDAINGVDESEQKFKIVAGFTMDAPDGSFDYKVGGDIPIRWTCTSKGTVGFVENVKFAYSINNGAYQEFAWNVDNPDVAGDQGQYTWQNIPEDIITTNAKIKVIDGGDEDAFEVSAPFVIKADFDMLEPGGTAGQTLTVGDPLEIQWKCKGVVSTVTLQYSYDQTDPASWVDIPGASSIPHPAPDGLGIRRFSVPSGVPDILGKQVWFRVADAVSGHPASYGVSDNSFRVKGVLNITAPRNAVPPPPEENKLAMEIDKPFDITWTKKGTIPTVIIDYCDDNGAFAVDRTYPIITIASADCLQGDGTYAYQWPSVPDKANGTSFIRIRDSRTADFSDVLSISDIFRIKGYIKVIWPNGVDDEKWRVGDDTKSIKLEWGGTMAQIRLSVSTTGENGTYNDLPVNALVDTSSYIGGGTLEVPWTVTDAISDQVRIKATYVTDSGVFDISDDDFTIFGGLTITNPKLNDRWVTQEDFHPITWNTAGTISTVALQYQKYDAGNNPLGLPVDLDLTYSNTGAGYGTYPWTIPNDRCAKVKVKIYDPRFPTLSVDESEYFTIDYYKVYFEVRDLLTGSNLSQITFKGGSSEGLAYETSYDPATGLPLGSPVTLELPYGHWSALITRTSYGDIQTMFTVDKDLVKTDATWFPVEGKGMLHMETSAIHIWRAYSDFTYKPDDPLVAGNADKISVSSWLERDGFMVSGGVQCDVYIYDETGTEVKHLGAPVGDGAVGTNPDAAGFFHLEWSDTTLLPGKVYTVITDITNAANAHFRSPSSFSVTETQQLQSVEDTVNRVLDKPITEVEENISNMITGTGMTSAQLIAQGGMVGLVSGKLDEQTQVILGPPEAGQTMEERKAEIMTQGGIVGMVQDSLKSFSDESKLVIQDLKTGAQSAVDAGDKLVATAKKYSWNASASPDPALTNDFVSLNCQGEPDKLPMLSIYSWDNRIIVGNTVMRETRPGFYTYQFQVDSARFTSGKAYTYIISEQETGGLVSGSAMVESMGISTVAGLAAAAPEAERAAKKALDAIKAVEAVLVTGDNINISLTLKNLKESVDELPELLNQEGPSSRVLSAINDISEKLKYFMGGEGIDLGELLDEKLGDTSSIRDVRNKTDSINSVVDLLLQILEARLGGVDAPIISTSLQAGSVKFRIMVVNPSRTKTQKVQVKKFMPAEVKPKDVMDLGGLQLEYDSERSIYYVFKNDVELKPGEARVFEVEVEDIWMVPDALIAEVKQKTDELVSRVRGTAFADKVKEVTDTVYPVLEEMPRTQSDDSISREQHIGIYRQNLQAIEIINDKLASLEKMMQAAKGVATPEVLEKSKLKINLPVKTTTWLIILLVIVFLGVLATVFFVVWQTQVRFSQNAIDQARKESFPGQKPEEKSAQPPK